VVWRWSVGTAVRDHQCEGRADGPEHRADDWERDWERRADDRERRGEDQQRRPERWTAAALRVPNATAPTVNPMFETTPGAARRAPASDHPDRSRTWSGAPRPSGAVMSTARPHAAETTGVTSTTRGEREGGGCRLPLATATLHSTGTSTVDRLR
jgi:hypothetical protein